MKTGDGTVRGVGSSSYYAMGYNGAPTAVPVLIPSQGLTLPVIAIAAGLSHSVLLMSAQPHNRNPLLSRHCQ